MTTPTDAADWVEGGPDPDVCADCDHQRAFHTPAPVNPDGICLGCLSEPYGCVEFVEPGDGQ